MWNKLTTLGLVAIAVSGCRSPQTVLNTLQRNDPSFISQASYVSSSGQNTSEAGTIEEYVQLDQSHPAPSPAGTVVARPNGEYQHASGSCPDGRW